jgi:hypothetical protein
LIRRAAETLRDKRNLSAVDVSSQRIAVGEVFAEIKADLSSIDGSRVLLPAI